MCRLDQKEWDATSILFFNSVNIWNEKAGVGAVWTAGHMGGEIHLRSPRPAIRAVHMLVYTESTRDPRGTKLTRAIRDSWLFLFPARLCDWSAWFRDWTEKGWRGGRGEVLISQ